MDNNTLQLKIKQRLNKLASFDYDNIEVWQVAEAFNKAQIEWVRTQLRGLNMRQEGDESSKNSTDDLQQLLQGFPLKTADKGKYMETSLLPKDYLAFKSIDVSADTECCKERAIKVTIHPVADVPYLLADELSKPSFDWAETFGTIQGNRIRVYTNGEFQIPVAYLIYYRLPRKVSFLGGVNLETGAATPNVTCELRDDIAEILVDRAAEILASDMEQLNRKVLLQQHADAKT